MRVLAWAAAAVVVCGGAAAAQEAQMAAGGTAAARDARDLQVVNCSTFKCKKKCVKQSACAWAKSKCKPSTPG